MCQHGKPVDWVDKIRIRDIRDGLSNTALAGEMHIRPEEIRKAPNNGAMFDGELLIAFARIGGPGVPIARFPRDKPGEIPGFGSWHPGACNFVFADGSIQAISSFIDTVTLAKRCHRADGQTNDVTD